MQVFYGGVEPRLKGCTIIGDCGEPKHAKSGLVSSAVVLADGRQQTQGSLPNGVDETIPEHSCNDNSVCVIASCIPLQLITATKRPSRTAARATADDRRHGFRRRQRPAANGFMPSSVVTDGSPQRKRVHVGCSHAPLTPLSAPDAAASTRPCCHHPSPG